MHVSLIEGYEPFIPGHVSVEYGCLSKIIAHEILTESWEHCLCIPSLALYDACLVQTGHNAGCQTVVCDGPHHGSSMHGKSYGLILAIHSHKRVSPSECDGYCRAFLVGYGYRMRGWNLDFDFQTPIRVKFGLALLVVFKSRVEFASTAQACFPLLGQAQHILGPDLLTRHILGPDLLIWNLNARS